MLCAESGRDHGFRWRHAELDAVEKTVQCRLVLTIAACNAHGHDPVVVCTCDGGRQRDTWPLPRRRENDTGIRELASVPSFHRRERGPRAEKALG